MAAFIYAELGEIQHLAYSKPILAKIKKQFPEVDYLDLDSFSEEFLVTQACQLVEIADKCAIYFKAYNPEAEMGATLRLAEILIRRRKPSLIMLQGPHTRLERLFSNRKDLIFLKKSEFEDAETWAAEQLAQFYADALL